MSLVLAFKGRNAPRLLRGMLRPVWPCVTSGSGLTEPVGEPRDTAACVRVCVCVWVSASVVSQSKHTRESVQPFPLQPSGSLFASYYFLKEQRVC